MIRFIWHNWKRKKEQLTLLVVGVLIIAAGLSYLIGLSEQYQLTIVEELQLNWQASYDLVVRSPGSRSETEKDGILDSNYLSGIPGGISLDQYEQIKAIPEIEVAAPIAFIGMASFPILPDDLSITEPGFYRYKQETSMGDGINRLTQTSNMYGFVGEDNAADSLELEIFPSYFLSLDDGILASWHFELLAAIDPIEEAKLVGLDQAMVPIGRGRYFDDGDSNYYSSETDTVFTIPLLISTESYANLETLHTFEKLDINNSNNETLNQLFERIEALGGEAYLDQLEGEVTEQFHYNERQLSILLMNSLSGYDIETGERYEKNNLINESFTITSQVTPLRYQSRKSPFPEQWPFAYELETITIEDINSKQDRLTRFQDTDLLEQNPHAILLPEWVGFFDPSQLKLSQNPRTELPMETYRPLTAELVLDSELNAVNPPFKLEPSKGLDSFITSPPTMLTTLGAAKHFVGDQLISAIRIKVADVDTLSEQSQAKLEQIAMQIEEETGLITDITLGSSLQPILVYVPEASSNPTAGWFQQEWIKLGTAMEIFRETNLGYMTTLAMVIVVAVLYVWATGLINLQARKKELAILLAIGWRPSQIRRLLLIEAWLLGGFTALVSWLILAFVYWSEAIPFSSIRFGLTGLIGLVIYLLGAILPILLVNKLTPAQTIQRGEVTTLGRRLWPTTGLITMAINHFLNKWKRYALSVMTIAMPSSLLAIFIYITLRLHGLMSTTRLGQYLTVEVGPMQYTAATVALIIALLTTVEIIWQNVSERQAELALLKAIGWRKNQVRLLIWLEGLLTGILASLIALLVSFVIIAWLEQAWSVERTIYLVGASLVPLAIGLIGSIVPAEKAIRVIPINGLHAGYSNRAILEKWVKWMIVIGISGMIITLVYMVFLLL